jgi:hypothetical protein
MVQNLESSTAAAAIAAAEAAKEAEKAANKALVAISALPVIMHIIGFALIDMRKCHRLAPNSPKISAVCGTWAKATEAKVNAGSAALFDDTDVINEEWTFILDSDDNSSLGIVVTSQTETVGMVALTAQELIRTERTSSGVMKVIKDLSFPPKCPFAGKLKIIFKFEKYKAKKIKKSKTEEALEDGDIFMDQHDDDEVPIAYVDGALDGADNENEDEHNFIDDGISEEDEDDAGIFNTVNRRFDNASMNRDIRYEPSGITMADASSMRH